MESDQKPDSVDIERSADAPDPVEEASEESYRRAIRQRGSRFTRVPLLSQNAMPTRDETHRHRACAVSRLDNSGGRS
jgi:hypothetical protein